MWIKTHSTWIIVINLIEFLKLCGGEKEKGQTSCALFSPELLVYYIKAWSKVEIWVTKKCQSKCMHTRQKHTATCSHITYVYLFRCLAPHLAAVGYYYTSFKSRESYMNIFWVSYYFSKWFTLMTRKVFYSVH